MGWTTTGLGVALLATGGVFAYLENEALAAEPQPAKAEKPAGALKSY